MAKVKHSVNKHYEESMKRSFYESETAKVLEDEETKSNIDWESSFFLWHRPTSNVDDFKNLSEDLRWVAVQLEKRMD